MKKLLSVVLLAAMMTAALASCSSETTTTTAATTTKAPAATTTKVTAPSTEPIGTDPDDVPTYPKVPGDGLEELTAGLKLITSETDVKVDMETLATVGFNTWNEEKENIAQMFDGVDTYDEWYFDEDGNLKDGADPDAEGGPTGGGPGKIGGSIANPSYFYFGLTDKATLGAYVIVTGNDNSKYPGRNPVEWHLYATNDQDAFEASSLNGEDFDESKWALLDYVYDGKVTEDNFAPCGYEIDADAQGAYQYYVWVLEYTTDGVFQAAEFALYVK